METGSARLDRDIDMIVGVAAVVGQALGKSAKTAVAVGRAARKWSNYKPPRYMLLSCPKGREVQKQWERLGRGCDIVDTLKFGAMLLNVTQHVDSSPIYGKGKHIVARNPGVKGWLKDNCHGITYVTAMSYRKLAETTCRVIKLPQHMPLEWVLPGTESEDKKRELNPENKIIAKLKRGEFLRQIRECRARLCKLLEGVMSVNQLYGNLDKSTVLEQDFFAPQKKGVVGGRKRGRGGKEGGRGGGVRPLSARPVGVWAPAAPTTSRPRRPCGRTDVS